MPTSEHNSLWSCRISRLTVARFKLASRYFTSLHLRVHTSSRSLAQMLGMRHLSAREGAESIEFFLIEFVNTTQRSIFYIVK